MAKCRPWTGAEHARLKAAWAAGLHLPIGEWLVHLDTLAKTHGRTVNALRCRASKHGFGRYSAENMKYARRFSVALPPEIAARFAAIAAHRGVTSAAMLREMVIRRLEAPLPKR